MKCVLLEMACPDTRAMGVRGLSSFIESRGHTCRLVFLTPPLEKTSARTFKFKPFSQHLLDSVKDACRDADLIGLSLLSFYYDYGVQLTDYLKKNLDIPIIWGSYHAMGQIEDSLHHADLVCVGEGEYPLAELLDKLAAGESYSEVPNLAYMQNGEIQRNEIIPLIQNLDELPFLDYRLDTHFVLNPFTDEISRFERSHAMKLFQIGPLVQMKRFYYYKSFISRGCPYECAYCCESMIHDLYRGQKQMRRRSPENFALEMEQVRKTLDFIEAITFSDDSFSEASDEEIEHFSEVYKKRVGLPFTAQFNPLSLNKRKIEALIDAGLQHMSVGIQSGARNTKILYRRNIANERIMKTAMDINSFSGRVLPPEYHFIVDNPWETTEDLIETIDFIQKLPRPRTVIASSLVLYPGTRLYERAHVENRIHDELNQIYRKSFAALEPVPANLLFTMSTMPWIPSSIIQMLNNKKFLNWKSNSSRKIIYTAITLLNFASRAVRKSIRILTGK